MRRSIALLLCTFVLASAAIAQTPDKAGLDTLLSRMTQYRKLMGYVQISKNGKVLYGKGFGEARPGVPNSASTVYRIGSISKVFTATLVMQQVDAGTMSLDDKLAKWYPNVPNAAKITIDQMLSHYSGIHSITDDSAFASWEHSVEDTAEILRHIISYPSDFEPGAKFAYSNTNYMLLGFILQKVSGKSYPSLLQERISAPLKLRNTAIGPDKLPAQGPHAASWVVESGKWQTGELSKASVAAGAGGIVSTVPELSIFIDALMRGKLTSESSLAKMKQIRGYYGRGLMRFPFHDRQAYGHNGHIDNFNSSLGYFPKDSSVVSVVCNGVNFNTNDLLIGVLSLYYGQPYTIPDFSKGIRLTTEQLERLSGVYTSAEIGMDITITATESGIKAQATGQGAFELEPVSTTLFGNDSVGVQLDFVEKDGTPQTMLLMQGGARIPFKRK